MQYRALSGARGRLCGYAALAAAIAGIVRGITGFGGAMVMSPPMALLLGPLAAVPVVLLGVWLMVRRIRRGMH